MVITFSCVCVWFLSRKKTARLAIYITDISPVKRHQGKNEKTEHILKVIKPSSRIAVSIKRGTGNKLPDPFFFLRTSSLSNTKKRVEDIYGLYSTLCGFF